MNKMTDEDEIEASRAPLLEHLVELRTRLVWAIVGVIAGFIEIRRWIDAGVPV